MTLTPRTVSPDPAVPTRIGPSPILLYPLGSDRVRPWHAVGMASPIPTTIRCVDCGGTCHVISFVELADLVPGDVVAFRCEDCMDRWDIEVTEEDLAGG